MNADKEQNTTEANTEAAKRVRKRGALLALNNIAEVKSSDVVDIKSKTTKSQDKINVKNKEAFDSFTIKISSPKKSKNFKEKKPKSALSFSQIGDKKIAKSKNGKLDSKQPLITKFFSPSPTSSAINISFLEDDSNVTARKQVVSEDKSPIARDLFVASDKKAANDTIKLAAATNPSIETVNTTKSKATVSKKKIAVDGMENKGAKKPRECPKKDKKQYQRKMKKATVSKENKEMAQSLKFDIEESQFMNDLKCIMSPTREKIHDSPVNFNDLPQTPTHAATDTDNSILELTKKMRTPVKESTFATYDSREEQGLDQFAVPDDDPHYEKDCKILKAAFKSGEVEEIDPNIARRMFMRNLAYLTQISLGEIYCCRHEEYVSDYNKRYSMDYAPGCIIFGNDNLGVFMKLMGKHLTEDADDHRQKIPYFMLVLVPELITKILMGVYNISKKQAVDKKLEIGIRVTEKTQWLF